MKREFIREYKRVGLRIAYYRKQKELTQQDVGNMLEVDASHISKIERGVVGMSLDTLLSIAQAIGIPAYLLLDFRDMKDD